MTTHVTEGARRERRQEREWFVFPLGHSGLPPSFLAFRPMLARVCTPLTKSQEKEGLTPVY